MENEPTEDVPIVAEATEFANDIPAESDTPLSDDAQGYEAESSPADQIGDAAQTSDSDQGDSQTEIPSDGQQDRVHQYVDGSQVGIVSAITGSYATAYYTSISHQYGAPGEMQQSLDLFVTVASLHAPRQTTRSLDESSVVAYAGRLAVERILLLSCYDENVALSVAKRIAYEVNVPHRDLVTVDQNGQGQYNFRNLIELLGRSREERKAIYVWAANDSADNEISSGIIDSLLSANARVEQYKHWLAERGLYLICLIPPQRVQNYKDSHFASLRNWDVDFLSPLLERYEQQEYEALAETIRRQRLESWWSGDDNEFYKEICKHLKAGNLCDVVENRTAAGVSDALNVAELFNKQDRISDAVLYCATYFADLSPQDFSFLVELLLDEGTEEVTRHVRLHGEQTEKYKEIIESVPLINRWRRDADAILRRCKLAAIRNEDDRRVIDFQTDGLRHRLSQYIRDDHYFFYESNFTFLRQQGLLFSPKKSIAEGARQLLVQVARQYPPNEVANWLYDVIREFEELTQAADRLRELTPLFQLLPDSKTKAARRYVSNGLSKILIRLNQEEDLSEAVRLFWLKLLHSKHQWFLDLLRRMGDATLAESLKWFKQLLDQGSDLIRNQARAHLVGHLLHRDSSIYEALKELRQWSRKTPAGRIAQEVVIIYCVETNRQVKQQDYGQWPSSHPLFTFQNRTEAEEYIELLVGWVCAAAAEIDRSQALFIVADIFAGWYFILSAPADDSASVNDEVDGRSELNARVVRNLLLECLNRQEPGIQKSSLTAIWDRLKNDILDEVINLDAFLSRTTDSSQNLEHINEAATARRKLLDTRASLNELRNSFIASAAGSSAA